MKNLVVGKFCREKCPRGKFSSMKEMNFFKKIDHFSQFSSIKYLILWGEKISCMFLKCIFIYFKKAKFDYCVVWHYGWIFICELSGWEFEPRSCYKVYQIKKLSNWQYWSYFIKYITNVLKNVYLGTLSGKKFTLFF